MDFAGTVFRSSLGLEERMFPRTVFPNLAIHYTLEWLKEFTGLEFNILGKAEETDRTPEQVESLRRGLTSDEHLADRNKILPYVRGPAVLELGSGSGGFLRLLRKARPDLELLVGVEYSPTFFGFAAEELFTDSEEATKPVVCLARTDITKMEITSSFYESVILASIVHEIESFYGPEEVFQLFERIYEGLKQGGRIIIYDGFQREGQAYVELLSPRAKQVFQTYIQQTPRKIQFERDNEGVTLPISDAIDFAAKLQFDDPSTEYAEEYYPFTLEEYSSMLQRVGFEVRTVATFPEEIDISRVREHITVRDSIGNDALASDNNVLIVAEKSEATPGNHRETIAKAYLKTAYNLSGHFQPV